MDFQTLHFNEGAEIRSADQTTSATTSDLSSTPHMSEKDSHPSRSASPPATFGRRGDPRMHLAVAAKLSNPKMQLIDALLAGGFDFPTLGMPGASDRTVRDVDNVLLYQRKNQLNRRIRLEKKKGAKKEDVSAKDSMGSAEALSRKCQESKDDLRQVANTDKVNDQCSAMPNHSAGKSETDMKHDHFNDFFFRLPESIDADMLNDDYTRGLSQSCTFDNFDAVSDWENLDKISL